MAVKVVVAKAHEAQLKDRDVKKEYDSACEGIGRIEHLLTDGSINFVFGKGMYRQVERKMITACLFVNKIGIPIKELHGVIRLKFRDRQALIATMTIDFDENFMGVLNPDEALLVHLNIPVRGLSEDEDFRESDIIMSFSDVRITEKKE